MKITIELIIITYFKFHVPAEDSDLAEAVKVPDSLFVYILIRCLYPVSLLSIGGESCARSWFFSGVISTSMFGMVLLHTKILCLVVVAHYDPVFRYFAVLLVHFIVVLIPNQMILVMVVFLKIFFCFAGVFHVCW